MKSDPIDLLLRWFVKFGAMARGLGRTGEALASETKAYFDEQRMTAWQEVNEVFNKAEVLTKIARMHQESEKVRGRLVKWQDAIQWAVKRKEEIVGEKP